MSFTLPPLPSDWKAAESFSAVSAFSSPVKRQIEPVGPGFLAHARRTLRGRTWSEDEKIQALQNVKKVEEVNEADLLEEEPEDPNLSKLDPKDWKSQDHYEVLGITKLRYKATEDQIRIAHRRKVLKHHPDKKAAQGAPDEDGLFKCIQKAFEILMDPPKRRQYDSVDEAADVAPPKKTTGDFIKLWKPVFDAEARFSRNTPVPSLGTMESSKPEVDGFYSFWYNFDSWRSFEYLDEDVPDDTSNRDNKRFIEKKNKTARQKHKTEDTARLRRLVDDALNSDPRIRLFKENEKKAKEQRKWEREAGARAAAEAEKNAKEQAEKAKADAERQAKESREAGKKSKEAAKNAKKKNKRAIRGAAKDINYFSGTETASASQIEKVLSDIDSLVDKFDDVQLQDVAKQIGGVTDGAVVKAAFESAASSLVSAGKLSKASLKFFTV